MDTYNQGYEDKKAELRGAVRRSREKRKRKEKGQ